MGIIRKLPPELVDQIAAGEVIERPASVVKELVENALDAGARRVEVAVEDCGKRLVRVTDDGRGIAAEDLRLAVESHATSKLAALADLFTVQTLGFRGEALASMGSVAELRIASRQVEGEGAEIRVRGGIADDVRPCGCAVGTVVEVRDLFFNTPARRKFLRDGAGELRPVIEALTRLALGAPGIGFRLVHDGKLVLEAKPTADPLARIADLFGKEVAQDLVPIDGRRGAARISGWVTLPRRTRGDAREQHVTLHTSGDLRGGRPIRDKVVTGAVRDAYQGFLMVRRHPIVFLDLEVPADAVDVNVHPTKLEVRFRESREVWGLVRSAIRGALEARKEAPMLASRVGGAGGGAAIEWDFERKARPVDDLSRVAEPPQSWGSAKGNPLPPGGGWGEGGNESAGIAELEGTPGSAMFERATPCCGSAPSLIAPETAPPEHLQLATGYLLVARDDGGFEVVDPHALHERILYEEWKARIAAGAVEVQSLLAIPTLVEVTPLEEARLARAAESLAAVGLVVESFGSGTAAIQAIPAILEPAPRPGKPRRARDWAAMLRDLLTDDDDSAGPSREAVLDHLTATLACKAAVKLGERLEAEEVRALLERRDAADRSHLCPHGRPTTLVFREGDLERQFKR